MLNDLATRIDAYLLASRGWVGAAEICQVFGVNERALRADRARPGLCSGCAISGDRGFRHVACATDEEFSYAYGRMRRHALGEMVHARQLLRERLRRTEESKRPPLVIERATGQVLLLQFSNTEVCNRGGK